MRHVLEWWGARGLSEPLWVVRVGFPEEGGTGDVFKRVFAKMSLEKEWVQVPGEHRAEGLSAVWALNGE